MRLIDSVRENADAGPLVNQQLETEGKTPISSDDLKQVINNSSSRAIGSLSLEDRFALMRFAATSAGAKMGKVNEAVRALGVRWANLDDPATSAESEAVTKAIILRHVDADAAKPKKQTSQ